MQKQKYKQTTIGKIPEDWEVIKLDNIIKLETGKRAKGGALNEGSVASIGGEHIDRSGNVIWQDMKFIPEDLFLTLTQGKVKIGDILLVKDGATTGKVAIVNELKYSKVAVNEHIFILRSKFSEKLINEFLFYILFSTIGQNQIKLRFHGMIGGIKRNDIESLLIPLPPILEQKKIVEIISKVRAAIQKVDENIAKTERLKRRLIQKLLTKGIRHKEFKDAKIGRVPKEWDIVKLEDYAYIKGRIGWRGLKASEYTEKGPYLIANKHIINQKILWNICDHLSEFRYEESPEIQLKINDIVMSKDGTIGEVAFIDHLPGRATINSTMMLVRVERKSLSPRFLFYFLQGPHFRRFIYQKVSGTSIPHIFQRDMKNFNVPLPPFTEQERISKILLTVDKKLEFERKRKEKIENIKNGLMNNLLTGKKRVRVKK